MGLKIETIFEEEIPVIKIEGELTRATKNKYLPLQSAILKQAKRGNYRIILDLNRLKSLDSEGLKCLLEISEIVKMHEGKLVIVTENIVFRKIFSFRKFANAFEVFDSLSEAIYSLADFADFTPYNP